MLQLRFVGSNKGSLWLVEPNYQISTDTNGDITVEAKSSIDSGAYLHVNGDKIVLVNGMAAAVRVNGEIAQETVELKIGDSLAIGYKEMRLADPKAESSSKGFAKKAPKASEGWSLTSQSSALAGRSYALEGTQILGRSKECHISLNIVHLSRKHAELSVTESGLEIRDLNSSNGTFVNGKRVSTTSLKPGDELSFDTLRFKVVGPEVAESMTEVRHAARVEDDGLTTVRPAINQADISAKLAAAKSAKAQAPKRAAPRKIQLAPNERPQLARESTNSGNIVGWIALGVIVVGLAVFLILT